MPTLAVRTAGTPRPSVLPLSSVMKPATLTTQSKLFAIFCRGERLKKSLTFIVGRKPKLIRSFLGVFFALSGIDLLTGFALTRSF